MNYHQVKNMTKGLVLLLALGFMAYYVGARVQQHAPGSAYDVYYLLFSPAAKSRTENTTINANYTTFQRPKSHRYVFETLHETFVNCTSNQDCSWQGQCNLMGTCVCDGDYITYECDPNKACCYRQKHKWPAFLLSILVGMISGADRFYLGYIGVGVGKLVYTYVTLVVIVCITAGLKARSEVAIGRAQNGNTSVALGCMSCLGCLWSMGLVAWWLSEWIRILTDSLPDANGAPLYDSW